MVVDIDVIAGSSLDHLAVVADAVLAAVILFAVHEQVDITCLDIVNAIVIIELERRVELVFVVSGPRCSLMMAYESHTLFGGIVCNFLDIEIGIRLGEVKVIVGRPVTFPTDIPALDEDAGDAVLGSEVNVLFNIGGIRAVSRRSIPCAVAEVHVPPHTDILHRLAPRRIIDSARFVEVEHHVRRDEVAGSVADDHRAPRSGEGCSDISGHAV